MPAAMARGNEVIPAIAAATRARARVEGPSPPKPDTLPLCPDSRTMAIVEMSPAITHTNVETTFGLTPASRERSESSAAAATFLPNHVRLSTK